MARQAGRGLRRQTTMQQWSVYPLLGLARMMLKKYLPWKSEAQLRFVEAISVPANRGSMLAQEIIGELGESLRSYMGDYGYENYLKVKGLPTAVQVQRVAGGSVGSVSGISAGR